jgi:hypothetical protein
MQGDDETADRQSASAHAQDLQPSGQPHAEQPADPVPVGAPQREGRHRQEASKRQELINRRIADQRMVTLLSQDGFAGPRYARFEEELARYGISVLRGWMYSGYVFRFVAKSGFSLDPDERELEELARDSELREDLATMTVASALPRFRQKALVDGGWRHDGGARITTYFMGACAYEFPNEYRRHRRSEERWRLARDRSEATAQTSTNSVADEVLGKLRVRDHLRNDIKDAQARAVVALNLDGYTHEEIRQILDATSVRVIEGLIYRWRTKAKQAAEGERHA